MADFIDADIEAKLDALEKEEERLIAEGFYEEEEDIMDEDEEAIAAAAAEIKEKQQLIRQAHQQAKGKNRPVIPKKAVPRRVEDLEAHMGSLGMEGAVGGIMERAGRKRARSETRGESIVREASMSGNQEVKRRATSQARDRSVAGLANAKVGCSCPLCSFIVKFIVKIGFCSHHPFPLSQQKEVADKIRKKNQVQSNLFAKQGESDRHIMTKLPKHLFAGKRKAGKTDRR